MSEGGSPAQLNSGFATKVVIDVDDDEVKEDEMDRVMVTELPLVLPEVVGSKPAGLPSLMCCTSEYTPGTVLQVGLSKYRKALLQLLFSTNMQWCLPQGLPTISK